MTILSFFLPSLFKSRVDKSQVGTVLGAGLENAEVRLPRVSFLALQARCKGRQGREAISEEKCAIFKMLANYFKNSTLVEHPARGLPCFLNSFKNRKGFSLLCSFPDGQEAPWSEPRITQPCTSFRSARAFACCLFPSHCSSTVLLPEPGRGHALSAGPRGCLYTKRCQTRKVKEN